MPQRRRHRERAEAFPLLADIAAFFEQFPARRDKRSVIAVDAAGDQFDAFLARSVAVLPQTNDFAGLRLGEDHDEIGELNLPVIVDQPAVGQRNPLNRDRNLARHREHLVAFDDAPRRKFGRTARPPVVMYVPFPSLELSLLPVFARHHGRRVEPATGVSAVSHFGALTEALLSTSRDRPCGPPAERRYSAGSSTGSAPFRRASMSAAFFSTSSTR
jgi:hypothetical protein